MDPVVAGTTSDSAVIHRKTRTQRTLVFGGDHRKPILGHSGDVASTGVLGCQRTANDSFRIV